jgi:hypothetical protein
VALGTVQKNTPLVTVVAVGNTETSHTLRTFTRAFQVSCNDDEALRIGWNSGDTDDNGDYWVLRSGAYWWEDDVYSGGAQWTIYLEATDLAAGTVDVAIQEWK